MDPFSQTPDFFLGFLVNFGFIVTTIAYMWLSGMIHVFFEDRESRVRSYAHDNKYKKMIRISSERTAGMVTLIGCLTVYLMASSLFLQRPEIVSWAAGLWIIVCAIGLGLAGCTMIGFSVRGAAQYIVLKFAP